MTQKNERKLTTMIKVSAATFNKLHYLKFPYETHDETLFRVLGEFPEMQKKVTMLENMLIDKKGGISA